MLADDCVFIYSGSIINCSEGDLLFQENLEHLFVILSSTLPTQISICNSVTDIFKVPEFYKND